MTNQHPITPPQDKFDRWEDNVLNERENVDFVLDCVWKDGFKTGADQELEACVEWLRARGNSYALALATARRPKPPTLKEQALTALHAVATGANDTREQHQDLETIRRALEALPNA
jgi:hypothetical protein